LTKAKYKKKCVYCQRYIPVCDLKTHYGISMCKDKKDCNKHRKQHPAGTPSAKHTSYWTKGEDEYDGFREV